MVSLSIFEILNKGKNKKEQSFHILQTVKTILKKKKEKENESKYCVANTQPAFDLV